MGPVHLDLPEDVALAPATEAVPPPAARVPLAPTPEATAMRAAELIAAAKRPIAIIGSSAMRLADPSLLRKVIERHGLPFATTTMAKGLIDEDHPLAARLHRARVPANPAQISALGRPDRGPRLRHHRGRIRSLDRRRAAVADRHRSARCRAVGQARASRRSAISTRRSHGLPPCRPRPTAGRHRPLPIIAARSSRHCGRARTRSARMQRSTRCAAPCRATASFRSTSVPTPTRSPVNGRRTRRRAF